MTITKSGSTKWAKIAQHIVAGSRDQTINYQFLQNGQPNFHLDFKHTQKPAQPKLTKSGSYIEEGAHSLSNTRTCLTFSLVNDDTSGALARTLRILKEFNVNLLHIESRSSDRVPGYEFLVECDSSSKELDQAIDELKKVCSYFRIISSNTRLTSAGVPWFPRRIRDLDRFANQILSYGAELDSDHPGFTDEVYRKRRKYFADIAFNHKHGQPLPRVDYTEAETKTWGEVFTNLTTLYKTHACREHNHVFPLLIDNCGYRADNIPQLEDVSNFLKGERFFCIECVSSC